MHLINFVYSAQPISVDVEVMEKSHNYYSLDDNKTKKSSFSFKAMLMSPFKLPGWIVSFILARNITHSALNPSFISEQGIIHHIKTTNAPKDDVVVINFKKKPRFKWLNDVLMKLNSVLPLIPLALMEPDHVTDRTHLNALLDELDRLIQGTSRQKHCEDKIWDWSHLYLKGLECLDTTERAYVQQILFQRYNTAYQVKRNLNLEFFTLRTPQSAELDSVEVMGPNESSKSMSERKFVITCLARNQNYIYWIKDLNYTAKKLGGTAISFNYRGVDLSRGLIWTQKDMVNDVLAQVERLIALGVRPEHICIEGACLAGAIATIAAAKLHEQGRNVKLNSERSFRSLPLLLFGLVIPNLKKTNWWNPITYLQYALAGLIYVIVTPCLWLAGWPADAGTAWQKIPDKDKFYSVVHDPAQGLYDEVIHHDFSSIASLEEGKGSERSAAQHHFKPRASSLRSPKYRGAHFVSRDDLLSIEEETTTGRTNHDLFLEKLQLKFNLFHTAQSASLDGEESLYRRRP